MGQTPGEEGVPCQVRGVPCRGVPCQVQGGTLLGGTQVGYTPPPRPGQDGGVPCLGGGTQLGQQNECSLHAGRYASCVHAGGLSCFMDRFKRTSAKNNNRFVSTPHVTSWQTQKLIFVSKYPLNRRRQIIVSFSVKYTLRGINKCHILYLTLRMFLLATS